MKKLTVLSLLSLFWLIGCAADDATVQAPANPELVAFTQKIDQDIAEVKAKLPIIAQNIELTDLNRQNKTLTYSVKLLDKSVSKEAFIQDGVKENFSEELCQVPSSKTILDHGFLVVYSYIFEDGSIDIKTESADCQQQQNSENNQLEK